MLGIRSIAAPSNPAAAGSTKRRWPLLGLSSPAVLAAAALAAAGCGDTGASGTTASAPQTAKTSANGDRTGSTPEKSRPSGQKPRVGTVIRDFRARVSGGKVRLTATLRRPTGLALQVTKLAKPNPVKLGRVRYGRKQGLVALTWNLEVKGRKVPAGSYRLILLGGKGDGRSQPVVVKLPA